MEGEEGGVEHRLDGQVHEGNSEEGRETDEGQEEEGLQQKEAEGGSSNPEEGGEKVNDEDKERTIEQDTQWTDIEISDSFKNLLDNVERVGQGVDDQNKEMDSEEETRMDNMEKDRGGRGQIRRRTLKVKPNVENARKKIMTSVNRYEVLRGLEREDGE